jgi:hypothetical protein
MRAQRREEETYAAFLNAVGFTVLTRTARGFVA